MARITIRVLEGLERGRVFAELDAPVTIGREEDNHIQLNDDRVSRFHAKLQADGDRVILTDLDSTNGTRVNGHPVQIRVLQPGDLVTIGRCLLLYGDPQGWSDRNDAADGPAATAFLQGEAHGTAEGDWDFLSLPPGLAPQLERLFPKGAPPIPQGCPMGARAQLSDLLAYLHDELGGVLMAAVEDVPDDDTGERVMCCPWQAWQRLVALQAALAQYLKQVAEPD
jgi:hypothetical protein